jgi:hypothetical protein
VFGRLGAALTRSLGVRRLALVEDVVQAALARSEMDMQLMECGDSGGYR